MTTLDQDVMMPQDVQLASATVGLELAARTLGSNFLDQLTNALSKSVLENAYRSRLMAITGHDLKQPLQTISLLLEILGMEITNPDAKPHLQKAQRSVRLIAEGLDSLAMASRPDIDLDSPGLGCFNISDILQRLVPTWHEHAAENGVFLRVTRCSARVTSNVAMLTTILDNLVGNAIKYAPQGRVLVGCRRLNSHLQIQVLDTGVGIRPDRLEHVFLAFHQEDPNTNGLGLGLSIVQRTAATLGHRIRIKSEVGRGSVFSVEVPLSPSQDIIVR
jgi:signal transduction histidine kinase